LRILLLAISIHNSMIYVIIVEGTLSESKLAGIINLVIMVPFLEMIIKKRRLLIENKF